MEDPQKLYQALTDEFQAIQKDMNNVIDARQKLESQLQENRNVQKEFAGLADDANIYKLVGPVLLKQDRAEAVMNVDKRLEFIEGETYVGRKRIEAQITELSTKQEKKKVEIMQLQQAVQQAVAQAEAEEGAAYK
ncbi:Prefoldin [Geopyxis carbonaria]|nr:Prefoldin [Geopyxis carbonaria]